MYFYHVLPHKHNEFSSDFLTLDPLWQRQIKKHQHSRTSYCECVSVHLIAVVNVPCQRLTKKKANQMYT